jgi:hypothetical protein
MSPVSDAAAAGRTSQPRNLPHQTSERGMVQTPARMRASRGAGDGDDDRPIRHELVRQIRAQILEGSYDSPAKIEAAADRLASVLDLMA